jgi:hypothetical protein
MLKLNDAKTIRRVVAAAIFKTYDGSLEGRVKLSHFNFIFRDLVQQKYLSSRVNFDGVAQQLDADGDGHVWMNDFIAWMEAVSKPWAVPQLLHGHIITPFIVPLTP